MWDPVTGVHLHRGGWVAIMVLSVCVIAFFHLLVRGCSAILLSSCPFSHVCTSREPSMMLWMLLHLVGCWDPEGCVSRAVGCVVPPLLVISSQRAVRTTAHKHFLHTVSPEQWRCVFAGHLFPFASLLQLHKCTHYQLPSTASSLLGVCHVWEFTKCLECWCRHVYGMVWCHAVPPFLLHAGGALVCTRD